MLFKLADTCMHIYLILVFLVKIMKIVRAVESFYYCHYCYCYAHFLCAVTVLV